MTVSPMARPGAARGPAGVVHPDSECWLLFGGAFSAERGAADFSGRAGRRREFCHSASTPPLPLGASIWMERGCYVNMAVSG